MVEKTITLNFPRAPDEDPFYEFWLEVMEENGMRDRADEHRAMNEGYKTGVYCDPKTGERMRVITPHTPGGKEDPDALWIRAKSKATNGSDK